MALNSKSNRRTPLDETKYETDYFMFRYITESVTMLRTMPKAAAIDFLVGCEYLGMKDDIPQYKKIFSDDPADDK